MSATSNTDTLAAQAGTEFRSRVPPSEPLTTKGHAPGVKVGNDAKPEFHTETYEPGTAPKEYSHQPNTESETPGQALNPDVDPSSRTDPLGSMPGATSGSVYNETEFGKPTQGQTSQELHGAHAGRNKKEHRGLEGVGASATGETVSDKARGTGADLEGFAGESKGQRGKSGAAEGGLAWTGAEERIPASAEEVARER